ncbi:MAG: hypothetical protein VW547_10180 [Alphaproteobacteria bacterium]
MDPIKEPTQIAQSRGADRVGGQEQLLLVPPVTSPPPVTPPEALGSPEPSKGRRKAPPLPVLTLADLTPKEAAVVAAIERDPTLSRTCKNLPILARDLVTNAPRVDVAGAVSKAGAWCRANPTKPRPNGNGFLTNWIGKAEADAIAAGVTLPEPRPDVSVTHRKPPKIPTPDFILESREEVRRANEEIPDGETAAIEAGEPEVPGPDPLTLVRQIREKWATPKGPLQ